MLQENVLIFASKLIGIIVKIFDLLRAEKCQTIRKSDLDVDGQRHHQDGNHNVGDCQRHNEIVGGRLQTSLALHSQHHENVTEHGQDRKHEQQQRPEVLRPVGHRRQRRRQRVETTSVSGPAVVPRRPEVVEVVAARFGADGGDR